MSQYGSNMDQQGFYPHANLDAARSLYVGNLDPKVNDALLWEVFTTVGMVESCKIIKDKFGDSAGYGFVDFHQHESAERAIQTLNGKKVYSKEIKVNWASHATGKEETSNHSNIFVGDLSSEINDEALYKAFQPFGSISDARVMWDQSTGRSRGYGFVAFREKADAERAMTQMNNAWLGNRAIRCNWANQKVNSTSTPTGAPTTTNHSSGGGGGGGNYDEIANQTTSNNSTVYVGNLPPTVTESTLAATFQNYGSIEEVRVQKNKGYGFVKFHSHDQAARAILSANETTIEGRPIRCSWGKERVNATPTAPVAQSQMYPYYPQQYGQNYLVPMPYYPQQYAYPQGYQPDPNYYAQGYDPYAYAASYQQYQHPQHPHGNE